MDSHGLELKGPLLVQKVSTLPAWASTDEGRLVYIEDVNKIYLGNNIGWEPIEYTSNLKKYNIL